MGSLIQEFIYVGLGGFLGACGRFLVSRTVSEWLTPSYPYGTLIVNCTGSLVLGFFLVWSTERVLADYHLRLLIAIGFCGGYTTFSSYSFETMKLFEQGYYFLAASNILLNNVLSLASALGGAVLARSL